MGGARATAAVGAIGEGGDVTDYSAGDRSDTDPRECIAEALERLEAAQQASAGLRPDHALYALSALADVRVNVDAAILILVRKLRLDRPPTRWERIGIALGITRQAAHERYARQVHHDGYL